MREIFCCRYSNSNSFTARLKRGLACGAGKAINASWSETTHSPSFQMQHSFDIEAVKANINFLNDQIYTEVSFFPQRMN